MATPQPQLPASPKRDLPAVTIDGHALFQFSLRMNRALKRFEKRFGARELNLVPYQRQAWKPVPRRPR